MTAVEPPLVSVVGINFAKNGSEFTRKALQHHGHVWKADVFGAVLYGIGGAEGLKQFYDEANVKRWPGMSQNLKDAAWAYDGGYAIPPLDSEQKWAWRKKVFMEAVNSREAAEKYLAGMDATFDATLAKLGADGGEFAMWDVINELILGGLSKAIFGYGIADYKDGKGQADMIKNIQNNYKVFDSPIFADGPERAAFAANIAYLKAALAEYRAHPERYPDASLGNYLAGAEGLSEGDILMDMHQMVCVGSYGGVTSVAACMAYSLAKYGEARANVKAELAEKLPGPVTYASMRELPFTFAFLKETLRKWPIVHIVRGKSIRDMTIEGMLVPKDSTVIGLLHGTMHDPKVYTDPDEFEPERFLEPRNEGSDELWNGYQVVFGAGDPATQHACAGKNIAITVLLALLIRLVQHWDWDMVDEDEKLVTTHFSPSPAKGMRMRKRNTPGGIFDKIKEIL